MNFSRRFRIAARTRSTHFLRLWRAFQAIRLQQCLLRRADQDGVGVVHLPNWQVFNVIERDNTGFGVVIFRGVYVLTGSSEPITSWHFAAPTVAMDKIGSRICNLVKPMERAVCQLSTVLRTLANADNSRILRNDSFYGPESRWRARAVRSVRICAGLGCRLSMRDRITLTTFNAFAGGAGLLSAHGADPLPGYDEKRFAGVSTAHYTIENDIVHALGAAFVGRQDIRPP